MSDEDSRAALERTLASIVQDILGNASDSVGVAIPTATTTATAAASAATATTAAVSTVAKRQSILRWLKDTRKQLAPHADKVPLPIVESIAKTLFPPAGAVVPVIRYLQTPPTAKRPSGTTILEATVAPVAAAAAPPQIFIIPVVQPPPPDSSLRRTARGLGEFGRKNPVGAVVLLYALWRARGVPGRVVRALDRVVNVLCMLIWRWVAKATAGGRLWAIWWMGRARARLTGVDVPGGVVIPEAVEEVESERVELDVGDAAWVVLTALIALYVASKGRKIWRRGST
ncbi:hypothetical protein D9611_004334 [Ephemerocybe angulata]|uniref:Uncharacterized protein n=1 Tax=Ephemerocybe angulata TaxID=980116 RepID=A0A8H5BJ85_9AGAR|nr:hypothetical protein D9611_004334 [Tulosesus angulatus]